MDNLAETAIKSRLRLRNIISSVLNSNLSVAILSILLSLVILAVLSVLYGANPVVTIVSLFQGAFSNAHTTVSTGKVAA